jgi:hypothetical protein
MRRRIHAYDNLCMCIRHMIQAVKAPLSRMRTCPLGPSIVSLNTNNPPPPPPPPPPHAVPRDHLALGDGGKETKRKKKKRKGKKKPVYMRYQGMTSPLAMTRTHQGTRKTCVREGRLRVWNVLSY